MVNDSAQALRQISASWGLLKWYQRKCMATTCYLSGWKSPDTFFAQLWNEIYIEHFPIPMIIDELTLHVQNCFNDTWKYFSFLFSCHASTQKWPCISSRKTNKLMLHIQRNGCWWYGIDGIDLLRPKYNRLYIIIFIWCCGGSPVCASYIHKATFIFNDWWFRLPVINNTCFVPDPIFFTSCWSR